MKTVNNKNRTFSIVPLYEDEKTERNHLNDQANANEAQVEEEMADLYASPMNSIANRPLNLTLLNKRKLRETFQQQNGTLDDHGKRAKTEDDNSESENHSPKSNEDRERDGNQEADIKSASRNSILQHFYSFIQRKMSNGELDGRAISSDLHSGKFSPPYNENFRPASRDGNENNLTMDYSTNGEKLPSPQTDDSDYGLNYNAAVSRRLAGANTAKLMEFWKAMTGLSQVNGTHENDNGSMHDYSPTMIPRSSDFDVRSSTHSSFNSSPTPSAIPERTMRQNNWAVKVWRDWAIERNAQARGKRGPLDTVPLDIKDATMEGMRYWLPKFITEVRRRDKRPYPPDTLMQIASGLQRHLRHTSGRSDITFFDKYSPTFAEFREALKARSEAINSETTNLTQKNGEHDTSTDSNEGSDWWSVGLFNVSTAKGLFRATFYYNCVAFNITSMEEHHALTISQYHIGYDEKLKKEYLEFTRDSSNEPVRKLANPHDPRCIVKVFRTYFQHIPSAGLLYKRPLQSSENSEVRFSFNPVGINKLRETFKALFGGRRTGSSHMIGYDEDEEREASLPTLRRSNSSSEDIKAERNSGSEDGNVFARNSNILEGDNENRSTGIVLNQDSPGERIHKMVENQLVKREKTNSNEEDALSAPSGGTEYAGKPLVQRNNNNLAKEDDESCLTIKVPTSVKTVIVLQGYRRIKVNLDTMT